MKTILMSLMLILVLGTQAFAETSVWMVQNGKSVIYLGGTFHLLRPSDYPLPPEFNTAYRASDIIVFETDIGKMNDPSTQQKMMLQAMYADGSTVDKHLSPKTYRLLSQYCLDNGIAISQVRQFKPSIISLTLTLVELSKLGVSPEGVDTFFYKQAEQDRKPTKGLESIDEQIRFMVNMGEGNEDAFITYSIEDLKSIKQQYNAMVRAWVKGDVEKLDKLIVVDFKAKMPKIYRELLVERNNNWLPILNKYLRTAKTEFVLVGVGHLVGDDGIVESLRRQGYKVDKL